MCSFRVIHTDKQADPMTIPLPLQGMSITKGTEVQHIEAKFLWVTVDCRVIASKYLPHYTL